MKTYFLDIWKDGTLSVREAGKPKEHPNALPVIEVDDLEVAQKIQITFCRLAYDNKRMMVNDFGGELEDIYRLKKKFKSFLKTHEKPRKT